jgi:hypothetical protein
MLQVTDMPALPPCWSKYAKKEMLQTGSFPWALDAVGDRVTLTALGSQLAGVEMVMVKLETKRKLLLPRWQYQVEMIGWAFPLHDCPESVSMYR